MRTQPVLRLQPLFSSLSVARLALAGAVVLAALQPAFAQDAGQAQYKQRCQMCHGATGAGDTPTGKAMKLKPLTDADIVAQTDQQLFDVTKNGRNKMPPYKDKMTDAQIKEVVAHIRALQKKK